jgi:hypothetical protein
MSDEYVVSNWTRTAAVAGGTAVGPGSAPQLAVETEARGGVPLVDEKNDTLSERVKLVGVERLFATRQPRASHQTSSCEISNGEAPPT